MAENRNSTQAHSLVHDQSIALLDVECLIHGRFFESSFAGTWRLQLLSDFRIENTAEEATEKNEWSGLNSRHDLREDSSGTGACQCEAETKESAADDIAVVGVEPVQRVGRSGFGCCEVELLGDEDSNSAKC